MGSFNVLRAQVACATCGKEAPFEIQFKYGHCWLLTYAPGDRLRWGGNDVGEPGVRRVRVEGIGGPCPVCGEDSLEFDLIVEYDRIVAVQPVGVHRESFLPEGYVVEEW